MEKPYIGDALREIEPDDILRTNRIMVTASLLGLMIGLGVHLMVVKILAGLLVAG